MKVAAQPQDAERLVVEFLEAALADEDCTVGVGVPDDWKPDTSPSHVAVANDGDLPTWPIVSYVTVRLVARAATTTDAKALCGLAYGLLCAHNGDGVIVGTRALTGVLPARDPETHAELAAATVRVTIRTQPIETGS